YAVYVAIWAYANAVVPLYWDQWDNQSAYLAYNAKRGGWLRWLFALHNEHRITIPRLLILADAHVFGGSNRFLVLSILSVQGLCAWLGVRLAGRYVSRSGIVFPLLVAFVAILCFAACQMENFTWGFQIQFVLVFVIGLLAFYLGRSPDGKCPAGRMRYMLALVAGVAACLSMANGLLVLPVLGVVVWLAGGGWGRVFAAWSLGAIMGWWHLSSVQEPFHLDALSSWSIDDLSSMANYLLVYLGNPVRGDSLVLGRVLAFFALVWNSIVFARLVIGRRKDPVAWVFVGMILFVLGSALLTAVGRHELSMLQATSGRYSTPAVHFWMHTGLLAAWMGVGGSQHNERHSRFLWVPGGVLVCFYSVYLLTHQQGYFDHYSEFKKRSDIAMEAVRQDVHDPDYSGVLYPRMQEMRTVLRWMRTDGPMAELYQPQKFEMGSVNQVAVDWAWTEVKVTKAKGLVDPNATRGVFRGFMRMDPRFVPSSFVFLAGGAVLGRGSVIPEAEASVPKDGEWEVHGHWNTFPAKGQKIPVWIKLDREGYATGEMEFSGAEAPDRGNVVTLDSIDGLPTLPFEVVHQDSAWALNGCFPSVLNVPSLGEVWGSWNGADVHTGKITIRVDLPQNTRQLILPFITGPGKPCVTIRMGASQDREPSQPIEPESLPEEWWALVLDLSDIESYDGFVEIELDEFGKEWGQWAAFATPRVR
ncbi:MAG: hypothetical protein JW706_07700, partial [Opitutales bacterium]|nr:hypothetical protein [Opitutales bacterium]